MSVANGPVYSTGDSNPWPVVRQRWEYQIVYMATEAQLNELGANGWELVTECGMMPESPGFNANFRALVFKRPRLS